jgi:membrane protein
MPAGLYESVRNTIQEIISQPRLDILSFGFLFAIFAATNGMSSLMRAFNMALKQRDKRSYFESRWIAFLLTSFTYCGFIGCNCGANCLEKLP